MDVIDFFDFCSKLVSSTEKKNGIFPIAVKGERELQGITLSELHVDFPERETWDVPSNWIKNNEDEDGPNRCKCIMF